MMSGHDELTPHMSTLRASVCLKNVIVDITSGLLFGMNNAKLVVSYHVVHVIVI